MTRVLLLEDPHQDADAIFAAHGIDVIRQRGALDETELIEALDGVHMVGIRSKTIITKAVFDAHPQLRAIGAFCIGTNQIDLRAASDAGVAVFNAPYSNTRSVVELAIAEIIALTRRLTVRNSKLHRGIWDKSAAGSHEVRGRTLGIVGYGNIGTQLSVLAEALGMKVVFYDIAERLALGNARRVATLEELLQISDVVSLHVDGASTNHSFFGTHQFAAMKPGALFINLSRGFVTDLDALVEALESGHIAGAAIDVFPTEPKQNGDTFTSPLVGMDNVILTPHVGGSTLEAQVDIAQFVAGKLCDYEHAATTEMSVNLPNLVLQPSPTSNFRLALIHRNMPGVLATLNQLFATYGANIDAQILSTVGRIGYVLTDLSTPLPQPALAAIEKLPETVRMRVVEHTAR